MTALPASITRALRAPAVIYSLQLGRAIRRALTDLPHIDHVQIVTERTGLTELRAVCGGVPHTITIRAERDALAAEIEA